MSFQQVFYTSCEEGLGGGKGFQVKAASPGIPPAILQKVERLGLYVPPLSSPSRPTPEEIRQFPVSLIFQTLDDSGAILGQAKYIGVDYTDRYGNFFTHSLISTDPFSDFFQVNRTLPIETWMSESWVASEHDLTELPDLEKTPFGGTIDFANVHAFLQDPFRREILPAFLTAIVEALETNRRIVIVDDNENIALWIAVASYALPFHLALRLTFNTYVRDPYTTEALIVGTTEDSTFSFAPHEIEHQFFVFDTKGERFTKIEQPSGFASKSAFIYRQTIGEVITGFAVFIEHVAPNLPIGELEDALSTYCYFENIPLPDVNDVKVLIWCAKYFEKLADRDFSNLFGKVTGKSPIEGETLRAGTDFYLATLSSGVETATARQIETLYLQWLFSEAGRNADINVLAETAEKLPRRTYQSSGSEKIFTEWLKNLRDADTPTRFVVMLDIGEKLGFVEKENETLRLFGKNILGKWLQDSSIQQAVRKISSQPGGESLLEGIAEFMIGQIDDLPLFKSLSILISDANSYWILSCYAVKTQNLPLYLRLAGTKENLNFESPERVEILTSLLADVRRTFEIEITEEVTQAAFSAIWLNRIPTLEEANRLLSPPLLEHIAQPQSEILPLLVDSLGSNVEQSADQQRKQLIDSLLSGNIFTLLGDQARLVEAYHLDAELKNDLIDLDGAKIADNLNWLLKSRAYIPQIGPRLEQTLGEKFAKVKDVGFHAQFLSNCLKERVTYFLKGYDAETEKISKTSKNHPETARLLRVWIVSFHINRPLMNDRLVNWSKLLLKSRSKRDLEKIEKVLEAADPKALDFWLALKEKMKEEEEGFLKKIFVNPFKRQ